MYQISYFSLAEECFQFQAMYRFMLFYVSSEHENLRNRQGWRRKQITEANGNINYRGQIKIGFSSGCR